MRKLLLVLLVACGHEEDPPPRQPPRVSEPEVVAPPAPVFDLTRAPVALGGATTWASAYDVSALRFCPGDQELLALEATGHVRRYKSDGSQVSVADVKEGSRSLDCRADGTALAFDREGAVMLDASGKATKPPAPISGDAAMFDDTGNALVLTDDGVTQWAGDQVTSLLTPHAKALYTNLAEHGTFLEIVFESGKPADDGLWMTRGGNRIKLPQRPVELDQVAAAPDGAVAIADMMMAYGWVVKGKSAKRQLLLDQSGTHIKAIGVSDKWFIVIGADGDIWKDKRPGTKWLPIQHPCGENESPTALALAHDDARLAVACTNIGVRIFDIDSGAQLSTDGVVTAASLLAWSPSGDQLAIRDRTSIRVWKGSAQVAKIDANESRSLWWVDANQLGGTEHGQLTTWSIANKQATPSATDATIAARSPHGEVLVANRGSSGPNEVALLRGTQRTAIKLPESTFDWLDGVAIDASATHGLLWRGQYNGEPALEIYAIDFATMGVATVKDKITSAALGSGGFAMATVGGNVIWNAGKPLTLGHHTSEVTTLAISHDIVAAGGKDGAITLWTITGTKLGTLAAHSSAVWAIAFAPDGKHLATSSADGTKLWNLAP